MLTVSKHAIGVEVVRPDGTTVEETDTLKVIAIVKENQVDVLCIFSKLDKQIVTLPTEQFKQVVDAIKKRKPT